MASKNDLFVSKPYVDLNSTKTLSMAVVGDIDYNLGLTAQLDITKEYNVQTLIILGDYVYASGSKVLSILESHGFTKGNTDN
jgi:predicted phosphodiesterase